MTGRFEEAIEAQRNALARNPDFLPSHAELAVNYGELGREKEQRAAVAECLRISPDISLETLRARLPYKRAEDLERVLDGLRIEGGAAGVTTRGQ